MKKVALAKFAVSILGGDELMMEQFSAVTHFEKHTRDAKLFGALPSKHNVQCEVFQLTQSNLSLFRGHLDRQRNATLADKGLTKSHKQRVR